MDLAGALVYFYSGPGLLIFPLVRPIALLPNAA